MHKTKPSPDSLGKFLKAELIFGGWQFMSGQFFSNLLKYQYQIISEGLKMKGLPPFFVKNRPCTQYIGSPTRK
ncbi:MAG TPA: hypothetical protein DHV48_18055 [Prolixibacteraceae bacterium]|nr:hypothetical protein [Prolixibacteraceae bacterium]